jgi:hypothetical protein
MNKLYKFCKIYFAIFIVAILFCNTVKAQITGVAFGTTNLNTGTNLVTNGSFENCTASPGFCGGYWGANTSFTPKRDIVNWTETGGGTSTYAGIVDAFGTSEPDPPAGFLMINFGNDAVASNVPLTFNPTGEVTFASTPTFTHFGATYGNTDEGVGIEQTLTGLNVGNTYRLEMYVTGRDILNGSLFTDDGFFKVEIVDGANTYSKFLAVPTKATANNYVTLANLYMRFYINFKTTTTAATIRFISYGYIVIFGAPDFRGPEVLIDDVSVNDLGVVLPLQLLSFNAKINTDNIVSLNWNTSDETAVKNFVIERSTDALSFVQIETQAAKNALRNNYAATDVPSKQGEYFYRLKMIDVNGKTSYSEVKAIKVKSIKANTFIIENPVSSFVTLANVPITPFTISIISANAAVVQSQFFSTSFGNKAVVNVETLAAGIYMIKVNDGKNNESLRFVKK